MITWLKSEQTLSNKTLFQLLDIMYALLIDSVLKTDPNFVVDWVEIGIVVWLDVRQDKYNNLPTQ